MGLVNRPNDISLSGANQSQAKFKSTMGGNLLQGWVNLTIVTCEQNAVFHSDQAHFQEEKLLILLQNVGLCDGAIAKNESKIYSGSDFNLRDHRFLAQSSASILYSKLTMTINLTLLT